VAWGTRTGGGRRGSSDHARMGPPPAGRDRLRTAGCGVAVRGVPGPGAAGRRGPRHAGAPGRRAGVGERAGRRATDDVRPCRPARRRPRRDPVRPRPRALSPRGLDGRDGRGHRHPDRTALGRPHATVGRTRLSELAVGPAGQFEQLPAALDLYAWQAAAFGEAGRRTAIRFARAAMATQRQLRDIADHLVRTGELLGSPEHDRASAPPAGLGAGAQRRLEGWRM
jgi:hypothetical protein